MGNKEIRFIAEVGVYSAVALVLDFLAGLYSGFIWPLGGSISFAMVPIFIIAYKYGLGGGLTTGLIVGAIQILWAGEGAFHPVQVIIDYVIAYTLVGTAGIFSRKVKNTEDTGKLYYVIIGIALGGFLRTIAHIISGEIYFGQFAPEGLDTLAWSVIYNMGYMIPSMILSAIGVIVLLKRFPNEILKTY
jgi:thiamine transporter